MASPSDYFLGSLSNDLEVPQRDFVYNLGLTNQEDYFSSTSSNSSPRLADQAYQQYTLPTVTEASQPLSTPISLDNFNDWWNDNSFVLYLCYVDELSKV